MNFAPQQSSSATQNRNSNVNVECIIEILSNSGLFLTIAAYLHPQPCKLAAVFLQVSKRFIDIGLSVQDITIPPYKLNHRARITLKYFTRLQTLDLQGNRIGAEGMRYLSEHGLQHVTNLHSLNLERNQIGAEGM